MAGRESATPVAELLERCVAEGSDAQKSAISFLYSFRFFTTPVVVMAWVLQRLTMGPPKGLEASELVRYKSEIELPQRQRLVSFVQLWAVHAPSDLATDANDSFKTFLQKLQDFGLGKQSASLKQQFDAKCEDMQAQPKEKTISMPSEARPFWTPLTFGPADIAQQLTLIMAEKMRKVTPMSLSNTSEWVTESGKSVSETSPVSQLIEWTNRVYRWVMHQIRSSADDRRRAKMTKQLVKVAQECHKITDMNTCYAVCSALKAVVSDLKELKEIAPILDSLGHSQQRHNTSRSASSSPRIPVVQPYLLELSAHQPVYTDAGAHTVISTLGPLIQELLSSATAPYPFLAVKAIKEFLLTPIAADDQSTPLLFFSRRAQPSSPISGSSTLSRSSPAAAPSTALVSTLKQNTDLLEAMLRVLRAEKEMHMDLLSDKAREAALLMERFGDMSDRSNEDSSCDERHQRNTVYSPMLARPKSDSTQSQPLGGANKPGAVWNVSKSQPLPLPAVAPPPPMFTRAQQWQILMQQRGLPTSHIARYAKMFDDEDIELTQLPHLSHKMLVTLGIADEHAAMLVTSQ